MNIQKLLNKCRKEHNLVNKVDVSKGKNMLASKGQQFQVPLIEIRKNQKKGWFFTQRLTAHPEDPACMQALYELGPQVGMNGLSFEEYEGTRNIVNINLTARVDANILQEFLRKNNKVIIGDGFMQLTIPYKREWKEQAIFINGNVANVPQLDKYEGTEYQLISAVPSQMRRWTATYCRSDLVPKFEACFEKLTAGTASELLGHEEEVKNVVKCVAKYFLLMVPGIRKDFSLKDYGCTIFLDKFGGEQERCDGAAKVSDAVIADKLNIDRAQARSLFCQMRNFKTSKVAATVEPLEQISRFEGITLKRLGCQIIYVDKFEDIFDESGNVKEGFNGNLIHVGNPGRCDFLSDLNGFKHIPRITEAEESFMILDMGKDSKGHSNMQFLQYNQDYPGFEDELVRLGKADIKHRIRTMIQKRDFISGLDINLDKIYAPNLIAQITPRVFQQSYLKNAVEKAIVTSLNKVIHRMHFAIDGCYLRGTTGPEFWLDQDHFLQEHEIFINNSRYWGKHCVVLRNPRSASCETYRSDVVSLWTLLERILNSDISDSEKIYYCHWYSNISRNVMVCTGSDEFKDMCGGSDFDYDGYAVVFDPWIVKMLESKPAFQVKIPKDKSSAGSVFCNTLQEVVTEGFIRTLTTGNMGVADVAIQNSKVQTLKFYDPEEDEPSRAKVFHDIREAMGADFDPEFGKPVDYERQFTGPCEIGESEVKGSKNALSCSRDTEENFQRYLEDVSVQFIAIIGRIIDSAKTGESVTDPFCVEDEYGSKHDGLEHIFQLFRKINPATKRPFACIVWNPDKLKFEAEITEKSFKQVHKDKDGNILFEEYFLRDKIYDAQCRIVKWAVNLINGLRKKASITDEEQALHKKYASLPCTKSLKELDMAASDMANISIVSSLNAKAAGQNAIGVAQPYISDMSRMFMDMAGVSKEERFQVATAVKDIDTVSSFAYNQLKEETIQYALTLPDAIHTLRERVLPLKHKKFWSLRQHFVDGRSEDFVCTSFKFNGAFVIRKSGIGYYIQSDIRDFIKIPDATGKLLFRVVSITDEQREALNQKLVNKNEYTWVIETYFPKKDSRHPDAIYTIDKDGNKERACRIRLANDAFSGVLNNFIVTIDDVIDEKFTKGTKGNNKEIQSLSLLCQFAGLQES